MAATQVPQKQLELVREAKISDLFRSRLDPRLEASGVLAKDGAFYVIFDNMPHIAIIDAEVPAAAEANRIIEQQEGHRLGFEDIAYDPWSDRFYVLIESLRRGKERYMAKVQEYDASLNYLGSAWLDFLLDRPNKGLEGLTCVHRFGETHLLGLCEGTSAPEATKAASPAAGGSTSSPAASTSGSGRARSGCRRRSCSRTTVA